MCESVGKADLRSDHFDSEQSIEAVDLRLTFALQQLVGCLATTYKSYDDSNIGGKEQVRDIGIKMNNAANLTFHISNLVKTARDSFHSSKMGLVLRVFQSRSAVSCLHSYNLLSFPY